MYIYYKHVGMYKALNVRCALRYFVIKVCLNNKLVSNVKARFIISLHIYVRVYQTSFPTVMFARVYVYL